MPKIVTPETLRRDSATHAAAAQTAAKDIPDALSRGDFDAAQDAARTLEAAGCYIRRAAVRLDNLKR